MKGFVIVLALLPALASAPTFATPVSPPGQGDFVQFCKEDTAGSSQFTLGDCTSYVAALLTNSSGYVAQDCDFWRTLAPDVFYDAYDTYDQCIRDGARQLPF